MARNNNFGQRVGVKCAPGPWSINILAECSPALHNLHVVGVIFNFLELRLQPRISMAPKVLFGVWVGRRMSRRGLYVPFLNLKKNGAGGTISGGGGG